MKRCDRAGPEFGLQGCSNVADDSKHNVFVDWSKRLTWLYLPHRAKISRAVIFARAELTKPVRE